MSPLWERAVKDSDHKIDCILLAPIAQRSSHNELAQKHRTLTLACSLAVSLPFCPFYREPLSQYQFWSERFQCQLKGSKNIFSFRNLVSQNLFMNLEVASSVRAWSNHNLLGNPLGNCLYSARMLCSTLHVEIDVTRIWIVRHLCIPYASTFSNKTSRWILSGRFILRTFRAFLVITSSNCRVAVFLNTTVQDWLSLL